jgi:mutator protein MutT
MGTTGNYCDMLGGECHHLAQVRDDANDAIGAYNEKIMALETKPRRPVVGVAAIVTDNDRFLVAERLSGKMQGMYGAPGGHIEWVETFEEAAVRELQEETGLVAAASDCVVVGVDQEYEPDEDHHWVVIFVRVKRWTGKPMAAEPGKHGPWEWYHAECLPDNTLAPLKRIAKRLMGVD